MGTAKQNDYLKECIADAIIVLIKEKPMEKVSIDEIVKRAGVGRATYFRSFHSKNEAITFKFIKMWEQYCELIMHSTFLSTTIPSGTFLKSYTGRGFRRRSMSLFTESC